MFEDALMESGHTIHTKSKYWSLVALVLNCSALLVLILWPLLHPEALPRQVIMALLIAPAPPPPPAPVPQTKTVLRSETLEHALQAPSRIPAQIKAIREAAATEPSMTGIGQVDDRTEVIGILGSPADGRTSVVTLAHPQKIKVASGVMAGNLLDKVVPQYPAIAKAARIQGTVVLQATIAKDGTMQNLRVISGPIMLQQAALEAVQLWRYKPYLLNGEPVDVETTVNVVFNLGG